MRRFAESEPAQQENGVVGEQRQCPVAGAGHASGPWLDLWSGVGTIVAHRQSPARGRSQSVIPPDIRQVTQTPIRCYVFGGPIQRRSPG